MNITHPHSGLHSHPVSPSNANAFRYIHKSESINPGLYGIVSMVFRTTRELGAKSADAMREPPPTNVQHRVFETETSDIIIATATATANSQQPRLDERPRPTRFSHL